MQESSKTARRPKLEGLKGSSTIPSEIRAALNIPDGVLIAPFKEFSNVKRLINDYLQDQVRADDFGILYGAIIIALDDIVNVDIKEKKTAGKEASAKKVFISQIVSLTRYCKKIKLFLENSSIRKTFTLEYSKAIKIKRKEEKEKSRKEEIEDAKANLKHKGLMLMYNAANCSFYEINADLEKIKGKRKATTSNKEKKGEDESSVGHKNLDDKDEYGRVNGRRLKHELFSDSEENQYTSFVTTTSGGTYQEPASSNSSPPALYVTSLDEIVPLSLENLGEIRYMPKNESIIDRLMYSGIEFVDASEDRQYVPDPLDDDIRSLVNQFSREVRYKNDNFLLNSSKTELINITILLLSCHFDILKEYKLQQFKFHSYKPVENMVNREADYKVKYVIPFIKAVFHVKDKFQVYWDVPFDFYDCSNMSIQHRQTADAKFVEIGGLEIGAVVIKPFGTTADDIDNDIIRIGEITKKMLHRRVMKAKSQREFITFGVMIYGSNVEYYVHQYHPPQPPSSSSTASVSVPLSSTTARAKKMTLSSLSSPAPTTPSSSTPSAPSVYTFKLIQKSTLPTLPNTYTHMTLSLEYLIYYKKLMDDSLAGDIDIDKPYIYNPVDHIFTPTVTFLN